MTAPPVPRRGLRRTLASRVAAVEPVCREIRGLLETSGLACLAFPVELVARELLLNAVLHGHRGAAAERVRLRLGIGRRWIHLWVADRGPGFAWRSARLRRLPSQSATTGRGLAIAGRFAARLSFNRKGNEVTARFARPITKGRRSDG